MMGRVKSDQGQLFYEFHLGDAVPEDHLVRKIDDALDLSWLRSELAPHYSSMGRPSIDPELMIRMLVVGYVFAIRSERLICREVQVNLAYRWFCRCGIPGIGLDQLLLGDLARKQPLSGVRSVPTMDSATWCRTPAAASAARRLRPEVSKNSSTALSSNEGELARSITTCAPATASLSPSPVMVLTPLLGEAATTSWPPSRRIATVFEPIRPVPPITTIFMIYPPLFYAGLFLFLYT